MKPIDILHSILAVAALCLIWSGCAAHYAPSAPITVGGILLACVAFARKGFAR